MFNNQQIFFGRFYNWMEKSPQPNREVHRPISQDQCTIPIYIVLTLTTSFVLYYCIPITLTCENSSYPEWTLLTMKYIFLPFKMSHVLYISQSRNQKFTVFKFLFSFLFIYYYQRRFTKEARVLFYIKKYSSLGDEKTVYMTLKKQCTEMNNNTSPKTGREFFFSFPFLLRLKISKALHF